MQPYWDRVRSILSITADIIAVIGVPALGIYLSPAGFAAVYNRIRFSAALIVIFLWLWFLSYFFLRGLLITLSAPFEDLGIKKYYLGTWIPLAIGFLVAIMLLGTAWTFVMEFSRPIIVP